MIPAGAVAFPNHPFSPDAYGHNCTGCTSASPWKCDLVAHGLGEHEAGLKLLKAIEVTNPEPQPGDGPDYHAEHSAWLARQNRSSK